MPLKSEADQQGRFGDFGGRYVPETLISALDELSEAYARIASSEGFLAELDDLLANPCRDVVIGDESHPGELLAARVEQRDGRTVEGKLVVSGVQHQLQ